MKYRDSRGVVRRIACYTYKGATWKLSSDLEQRVEREQAGLSEPYEDHRRRPFVDHLDTFETYLSERGNTKKHIRLKVSRVRPVLEVGRFLTLPDLVASEISG